MLTTIISKTAFAQETVSTIFISMQHRFLLRMQVGRIQILQNLHAIFDYYTLGSQTSLLYLKDIPLVFAIRPIYLVGGDTLHMAF